MHRTLTATVLAGFLMATAPSSFLENLWNLLSVFWGDSTTTDAALGWDPDGGIDGRHSDEGLGWDPNGGTEGKQSDEGLGWDPDGASGPLQNTQAKIGCGWDPYGRCIP